MAVDSDEPVIGNSEVSSMPSKPERGGDPPEWELRFFEQLYRVERQARDKKPDAGETNADSVRRFDSNTAYPS